MNARFDENTNFTILGTQTYVEKPFLMYLSSVFCSIQLKDMAYCQDQIRVIDKLLTVQQIIEN